MTLTGLLAVFPLLFVADSADYLTCLTETDKYIAPNGDCFHKFSGNVNHADAKAQCEQPGGGQLPILPDAILRQAVADNLMSVGEYAWLRLEQKNSSQKNTEWFWMYPDGSELPFGPHPIGSAPWSPGQPDDNGGGSGEDGSQNLAQLLDNGLIKDEDNGDTRLGICQYVSPTDFSPHEICKNSPGHFLASNGDCFLEIGESTTYAEAKAACEPLGQVPVLVDLALRVEVGAHFQNTYTWIGLEQMDSASSENTDWFWVHPSGVKEPFEVAAPGTGPWQTSPQQPDDDGGSPGEDGSQNNGLLLDDGTIKDEEDDAGDSDAVCQYKYCGTFVEFTNVMFSGPDAPNTHSASTLEDCGWLCLKLGCVVLQYNGGSNECQLGTTSPLADPSNFEPNDGNVQLFGLS